MARSMETGCVVASPQSCARGEQLTGISLEPNLKLFARTRSMAHGPFTIAPGWFRTHTKRAMSIWYAKNLRM